MSVLTGRDKSFEAEQSQSNTGESKKTETVGQMMMRISERVRSLRILRDAAWDRAVLAMDNWDEGDKYTMRERAELADKWQALGDRLERLRQDALEQIGVRSQLLGCRK